MQICGRELKRFREEGVERIPGDTLGIIYDGNVGRIADQILERAVKHLNDEIYWECLREFLEKMLEDLLGEFQEIFGNF